MEGGAFALFFRPHPKGFYISRVPIPENLQSKAKKKRLMAWDQPGGGGEGEGAARGWNWLMRNCWR